MKANKYCDIRNVFCRGIIILFTNIVSGLKERDAEVYLEQIE